jgi:dihydroorotase
MRLLIKHGRLLDPISKTDAVKDILVENGEVAMIADQIDMEADTVIDAEKKWVTPGLIDVHVHLREPGFEYKETIATGSYSAAKGGFTTICCMPNTNPVIDNEILVEYIKLKAEREAVVNVLPIGSITKGQKGEELANIGKMAQAGICAISEDGRTVMNAGLLKKAMKYANMFNLPILSHCEDKNLAGSGVMNAGETAELIGMKGIGADSEEVIVARDIILARGVKAKLHVCHISTKGSVQLVREAKQRGENVTAEVCPHHFSLTEKAVDGYDTNTKMNPPLRSEEDVEHIKQGLKENTIEIIATDHAPHHMDEKNCEYDNAAFGIVGRETALPLGITNLVETNILKPIELIEKMSANPAKLLGIDKGIIQVGKTADITIIDPDEEYEIDINTFASKSKNSPFHGTKVKGKVLYTIVEGNIIVENGELTNK